MINIWKVSTLVFAGALAFVVGRGAIAESIACDGAEDVPTAEQITRLRLARGVAFLDRAEQEIQAATAAPSRARSNALAQIAKARVSLELALEPEPEVAVPLPAPRPKPAPTPRKKPEGSTTSASTPSPSPQLVNPFLRISHPVANDPLMVRR
jgi:hypothetical protein